MDENIIREKLEAVKSYVYGEIVSLRDEIHKRSVENGDGEQEYVSHGSLIALWNGTGSRSRKLKRRAGKVHSRKYKPAR